MKIRITGKGLPKAQYQNSQIINPASGVPSNIWGNTPSLFNNSLPPLPNVTTVGANGVRTNNGGFGTPTLQFRHIIVQVHLYQDNKFQLLL